MQERTRLKRAISAIPKEHWITGESGYVHWAGSVVADPGIVSTNDPQLVTCHACRGALERK